ncbi:MAG: hypothetical protein PHY93_11065 [Bacteriovorax sp.]|nr:hypothetical protein [Bacteriovorax sp.]
MKVFKLILLTTIIFLTSCSSETLQLQPRREIASGSCEEIVHQFFHTDFLQDEPSFFTKLNPRKKTHPSGKSYLELIADPDVIQNDPSYAKFLDETIEIIHFPTSSFGHVKLRIGTSLYDLKGVKFAGIAKYYPKMKKNKLLKTDGPTGFVFNIGADKIKKIQDEVEMMYLNSEINNIPPYDLYSSMIKIEEREINGKIHLTYASTSPAKNLANKRDANGQIIKIEGKYYLESADGYRVDVEKRSDGFYTQSYSCLTSATHVMEKYFHIDLNYGDFPSELLEGLPEDLQKAIMNENRMTGESPAVVIKYFED